MNAKGTDENSNLDYEVFQDLRYCSGSNLCAAHDSTNRPFPCRHKLDLFLPKTRKNCSSSTNPVVVFVHGGSWMRGDKRAYKHYFSFYDTNLPVAFLLMYYDVYWNVGRAFARSGIACAVISYRLSKLEFPLLLFKLLLSILLSTTLVLAPLVCVALAAVAISSLPNYVKCGADINCYLNPYMEWHSLVIAPFTVLVLVSLCIIWFAVCQNGDSHFISRQLKLAPLLISLCVSVVCLIVLNIELHAFISCFTVCLGVCLVHVFGVLQQKFRPVVRHPDHVRDVAASVGWVKTYAQLSNRFDGNRLFLCGHSAGGHLVSLVAIDSNYLRQVGLSTGDIKAEVVHVLGHTLKAYCIHLIYKFIIIITINVFTSFASQGVISISGVYNLSLLSGWLLELLLLRPVFGSDPQVRITASPYHCLAQERNLDICHRMPFLILNAENDFYLQEDAKQFLQELQCCRHPCEHHIIKGTNHLSIVLGFDCPIENPITGEWHCPLIQNLCVEFVRNNTPLKAI